MSKKESRLGRIGIVVGIIGTLIGMYFAFFPKVSNQDILIGYENSTDVEILNVELKTINNEEVVVVTFRNKTDKHGLNFNADLYNGSKIIRKTELFKEKIKSKFTISANQEISIPVCQYLDVKTFLSAEYGSFELLKVDFSTEIPNQGEVETKIGEATDNNYISYPFIIECTFEDIFGNKKFVQKPVSFHIKLIK